MAYEQEILLPGDNALIVDKIRILAGDKKQTIHDYISTCKSRLSDDGRTIEMSNKGWPKSIYWNGVEETNSSGVAVDGYRYLTFSGAIAETDTIDMYYYSFRNSDTEIYNAYNNAMIPPGLTSSNVTVDHMTIQAAIDLLEAESWKFYSSEGVRIKEGDSSFDPAPGFVAREKAIGRLYQRLGDLINQYYMSNIEGVLVD